MGNNYRKEIRAALGPCPAINNNRLHKIKQINVDHSIGQLQEIINMINSGEWDSFYFGISDQDTVHFVLMKDEPMDEFKERVAAEQRAHDKWHEDKLKLIANLEKQKESQEEDYKKTKEYQEYLRLKAMFDGK